MPTLANKQLDEYRMMCYDRSHGRILTPDGFRFICEVYKNDAPEAIGNTCLKRWFRYRTKAAMGGNSREF